MLVSPAALDAALQLAAVPTAAPTAHSSPHRDDLQSLMIPAALACFHLPTLACLAGTQSIAGPQVGAFASASRLQAEDESASENRRPSVFHDHMLALPRAPAGAACRISRLKAKPLQASRTQPTTSMHASSMAGQGCLKVTWQVEHPPAHPPYPIRAAGPPGVALRQVGGAAHAMGDLIGALQKSLSKHGGAESHQLITCGSQSVLPGLMGQPPSGLAAANHPAGSALWAVMRSLAREAPTQQSVGRDRDDLATGAGHYGGVAYLALGAEASQHAENDRTGGHGIALRQGASLSPLLVPCWEAGRPLSGNANNSSSGAWVLAGGS